MNYAQSENSCFGHMIIKGNQQIKEKFSSYANIFINQIVPLSFTISTFISDYFTLWPFNHKLLYQVLSPRQVISTWEKWIFNLCLVQYHLVCCIFLTVCLVQSLLVCYVFLTGDSTYHFFQFFIKVIFKGLTIFVNIQGFHYFS